MSVPTRDQSGSTRALPHLAGPQGDVIPGSHLRSAEHMYSRKVREGRTQRMQTVCPAARLSSGELDQEGSDTSLPLAPSQPVGLEVQEAIWSCVLSHRAWRKTRTL